MISILNIDSCYSHMHPPLTRIYTFIQIHTLLGSIKVSNVKYLSSIRPMILETLVLVMIKIKKCILTKTVIKK